MSAAQKNAAMMPSPRLQRVDVARGFALMLMLVYHFNFDLDYFGLVDYDFNNSPIWLTFRAIIVTLFLGLVGFSLSLAHQHGFKRKRYIRRMLWLVACAGLVSLSSGWLYADSMIFFGILHFIFVASLVGLLCLPLAQWNFLLGLMVLALGWFFQHPWFDAPALQWLGMMTHKPFTQDYVPFVPWFGVVLIGMAAGSFINAKQRPAWLLKSSPAWPWRSLALAGRHSLLVYMLHQPILFAVLWAVWG